MTVTEQAGEFRSVLELSDRFPGFVLPCLGVHPVQEVSPEEQRSVTLKDLDAALPLIELYKDKLVAIGEVSRISKWVQMYMALAASATSYKTSVNVWLCIGYKCCWQSEKTHV